MNKDKLLGYGIIFLLFLFFYLAIAYMLGFIVSSGIYLLSLIIATLLIYATHLISK